ncbi:MAG: putative dna topoisomerase iv (subunit a) protein [Pseudomonadota bacterium]
MSEHTPDLFAPADDGQAITLAQYAERAYLDYAVSVVKGRALPDVCDGQKPVQRRILFAMQRMGLASGAKPVKSARVVGDVLGRFHPHGDVAAYEALVRMAQDFSLRYPLIDGQGNFGSRDGDGAAAMRYTEARLTPYARLLLDEIDEGTVDFVPNYDGSAEEPRVLPARLPMVLLNGASGIAVGMATEIPPHNLREIAQAAMALLRDPQATLEQVLQCMPGPDFPGGGQIISSALDIREIYSSGRGSIKVRARHRIEDMARGQWQLVIHELPHGVSAQKVLEEIEELTNPKIKTGKKALAPEQVQLKQSVLAVLDTVRDESGKDAPVRLVFEPKSSRIEQQELLNTLLAHTSLQASVSVNLVSVGLDGRPGQKSLDQMLREWLEFRLTTVTRRTRHRLARVDDRMHILEGRQRILLDIDRVIRIIRESDEPKSALIESFALSERQAEDVLEIRLRQLARLEAIRIDQELQALAKDKAALEALLASPQAMKRQLSREIEADAKQFGDDRRTLIEEAQRVSAEIKMNAEPVTVILSERGWVRARQGHGHDWTQFSFKSGDSLRSAHEVMTTDHLFALASNGRVYSIPVSQLPSARGDGVPMTSLVDLEPGSRIDHGLAAHAEEGVLITSSGGVGFICQAGDLLGRTRQGKSFISLDEGDQPLRPVRFTPGMNRVMLVSDSGRALVLDLSEIKVLRNGGRGVTLLGLDKGERLEAALVYGAEGLVVSGIGRGAKPITKNLSASSLDAYLGARARKGKLIEPRVKQVSLSLPRVLPKT